MRIVRCCSNSNMKRGRCGMPGAQKEKSDESGHEAAGPAAGNRTGGAGDHSGKQRLCPPARGGFHGGAGRWREHRYHRRRQGGGGVPAAGRPGAGRTAERCGGIRPERQGPQSGGHGLRRPGAGGVSVSARGQGIGAGAGPAGGTKRLRPGAAVRRGPCGPGAGGAAARTGI